MTAQVGGALCITCAQCTSDPFQSEKTIIGPLGEKLRPDALTSSGRPVELKPNTPSGIKRGNAQIKKYKEAAGKNGRVIYYDP